MKRTEMSSQRGVWIFDLKLRLLLLPRLPKGAVGSTFSVGQLGWPKERGDGTVMFLNTTNPQIEEGARSAILNHRSDDGRSKKQHQRTTLSNNTK
ncbi:hypothetical protein TYRP_006994 [Tyrophagus putrescentiae]|nr:hypothetical protein TYRP_006994 [Tyrophagus putrescentiae]